MEIPIYTKLIEAIEAAKFRFFSLQYSGSIAYYPHIPYYTPGDLHGKPYSQYVDDSKQILFTLHDCMRKIVPELKMLEAWDQSRYERMRKYLLDAVKDEWSRINGVHKELEKCIIRHVSLHLFYHLKENKVKNLYPEILHPGQFFDIYLTVFDHLRGYVYEIEESEDTNEKQDSLSNEKTDKVEVQPEFENLVKEYELQIKDSVIKWQTGKDKIGCAAFCEILFENGYLTDQKRKLKAPEIFAFDRYNKIYIRDQMQDAKKIQRHKHRNQKFKRFIRKQKV